jgi:GABA(A) receptor-associated protein
MSKTLQLKPEEFDSIRLKYPDRIPIFVIKDPKKSTLPDIGKKKFLAPADITITDFLYVIRKWIKLKPEEALYIYIKDSIPNMTSTLGELYSLNKDSDGAMRITYALENTFGTSALFQ